MKNGTLVTMLTGWIQSIDINTQVDWILCADAFSDFPNDAVHPNDIDLAGLNNFKTTVSIMLVIAWTR